MRQYGEPNLVQTTNPNESLVSFDYLGKRGPHRGLEQAHGSIPDVNDFSAIEYVCEMQQWFNSRAGVSQVLC